VSARVIYDAALRMVGKPYIWGGDDPMAGYDCSGLVQELLAIVGLDPKGDQTAQQLYTIFMRKGAGLIIGPRCGTLVFYGWSKKKVTHVAMCITPTTLVEAGGGGSKTTTFSKAIAHNAYIRLRPIGHRSDLLAMITPAGMPL